MARLGAETVSRVTMGPNAGLEEVQTMVAGILPHDMVKVGQVFTPLRWAQWLIDGCGVFDAWLRGATVCDPTAGQGVFALALFALARSRGVDVTRELLSRVTLIEIDPTHLETFRQKADADFGIDFPSHQLIGRDVITNPPKATYDILVGNPPWANFADIPERYKEELKPYFVSEGLVPDKKKVLLGTSRTDMAALVLKVVLGKLLGKNGKGCFYVPLSLFTGDDAHAGFRNYSANKRGFAVEAVWEFTETKLFNGVSTAYCSAVFKMDKQQEFPVRYFRQSGRGWIEYRAFPLRVRSDPWRVVPVEDRDPGKAVDIKLLPEQKPRQGVNTCGASRVFIFDHKPSDLPAKFLFPLAAKEIWKHGEMAPRRWILLPYDKTSGRPLSWRQIEEHEDLRLYLMKARETLAKRKGTLIRSAISKGIWWSMLGVGPYSFAPYKVIWEAYGKKEFRPLILNDIEGQAWQANQAMHAYIPCWRESDAERICTQLRHPEILSLLRQLNGEGKCNWAQPGKIKKVLSFLAGC